MTLITTITALKEELSRARSQGLKIGLVPTMGALHRGHLSLVEIAKQKADFVAVSIFVNPMQFGSGEDFTKYPRNLEKDLKLLKEAGVDLVFMPEVNELYPKGFSTHIMVDGPSRGLCGKYRPGHFSGVATIVVKLFNLFRPDFAVFGLKDLQQCAVIKRVVIDLDLGIEIVLGPTIRETDGLAMSSRNAYLSASERKIAAEIYKALSKSQKAFWHGERSIRKLLDIVNLHLNNFPALKIQYLDAIDPETMVKLKGKSDHPAVAIAVFLGKTRLIDNIILSVHGTEKNKSTR